MFARPRTPLIHPAGADDMLAGMAHAMGCATLVDAPRAPGPVKAAPAPTQAGDPTHVRHPASPRRPR